MLAWLIRNKASNQLNSLTAGGIMSCHRFPPRPSEIQLYANVVTSPSACAAVGKRLIW